MLFFIIMYFGSIFISLFILMIYFYIATSLMGISQMLKFIPLD